MYFVTNVKFVTYFLSALFFRIKKKWWDAGARWPDSKLLDMKSTEEKVRHTVHTRTLDVVGSA